LLEPRKRKGGGTGKAGRKEYGKKQERESQSIVVQSRLKGARDGT